MWMCVEEACVWGWHLWMCGGSSLYKIFGDSQTPGTLWFQEDNTNCTAQLLHSRIGMLITT